MFRRIAAALVTLTALVAVATPAVAAAPARGKPDKTFSADVEVAVADIQSFWSDTLPDVYGQPYETIPDDRLYPSTPDDPPPACGGRGTTPYEKVKGNAFYCPDGDFVAWDARQLVPQLDRDYGRFAVALVFAHEWGHAIQQRTRTQLGASVYYELQADCFAGAWAQHATKVKDEPISAGPGDLEQALGGYLQFRDPPGADPGQQGAHGNAFDRVSAFQDGSERGAKRCRDYETDPPEVTESSFGTLEDAQNGGNLPLGDLFPLLRRALDDYWRRTAGADAKVSDLKAVQSTPGCDRSDGGVLVKSVVYCVPNDSVEYDRAAVRKAYDDIGDMGAGILLAAAWASSAQHTLGERIGTDAARVEADCLTGAWSGAVFRGEGTSQRNAVSLSPGDLDEAVRAFVSYGGESRTTAFKRVQVFRRGFSGGPGDCTDRLRS